MDVVSTMIVLAGLFVASHLGLSQASVRSRLVARLGEWGFLWLYFAVAAMTFGAAAVFFADHRLDGPPGPALGRFVPLRWALLVAVVLGVMAMVASFASYERSPYSLQGRRAREPRGLERVTRHPFFAGMALFAAAHAVLATHLVATVFMVALGLLAVAGAWAQDRKLLRLRDESFARYLAATSAVPFAAIASGRQKLVWGEMPATELLLGLVSALLLASVHDRIFAYHGAGVIAVAVGGALLIMLTTWLGTRRGRTVAPTPRDLPPPASGAGRSRP